MNGFDDEQLEPPVVAAALLEDAPGLSVAQREEVLKQLKLIFGPDQKAIEKWLRTFCSNRLVNAKPIEALKAGRAENVIDFLREAAP